MPERRDDSSSVRDPAVDGGGKLSTLEKDLKHASPEEIRERFWKLAEEAFGAGYDAAGRAYAEKADEANTPVKPESFVEREMRRREQAANKKDQNIPDF